MIGTRSRNFLGCPWKNMGCGSKIRRCCAASCSRAGGRSRCATRCDWLTDGPQCEAPTRRSKLLPAPRPVSTCRNQCRAEAAFCSPAWQSGAGAANAITLGGREDRWRPAVRALMETTMSTVLKIEYPDTLPDQLGETNEQFEFEAEWRYAVVGEKTHLGRGRIQ